MVFVPSVSWYFIVGHYQLTTKRDLKIGILHTFSKRIFNKLLDMVFLKTAMTKNSVWILMFAFWNAQNTSSLRRSYT